MMLFNPHKVHAYFTDRYILSKPSPKGWFAFDCAFCGGVKKCAVNFDIGYVKCWVCGAACNVCEFVEQIEDIDYLGARAMLHSYKASSIDVELISDIVVQRTVEIDLILPEGWQSILDGVGMLGDRARKHLEQRGFDLEVLDFKGFGYCNKHYVGKSGEDEQAIRNKDFFGYIIVPFKKDNILSYYIGRDYIGNFLRYKNPPSDWVGIGKSEVIYNEEALSLYKTIYTMEGWSDAEASGKRGTATLGWNWSKVQMDKYMKSVANKIVMFPDAGKDKATGQTYYQKATQTAMSMLDSDKTIYVVDLNDKYFDQFRTKDGERAKDICEIGWGHVYKYYKKHTQPLNWSSAMEIITK